MNGVLVLDVTWQPERIISFRRAVELLWFGKATPVTDEIVTTMRSPSVSIEIPAVIQLARTTRWVFRRHEPTCSRRGVLLRDGGACQFVINGKPCQRRATTIDHLLPQSRGGGDTWTNLVAACTEHNSTKANRTLDEMAASHGWAIRALPEAPQRAVRLLDAAGVASIPESWAPFFAAA